MVSLLSIVARGFLENDVDGFLRDDDSNRRRRIIIIIDEEEEDEEEEKKTPSFLDDVQNAVVENTIIVSPSP